MKLIGLNFMPIFWDYSEEINNIIPVVFSKFVQVLKIDM